ncbi:MAG: ABC transporter permease subunit [Candidatus Coatesbacteria bacterium]
MNWTIVRTTLRERMAGRGRWFSLVILFGMPLLWAGLLPAGTDSFSSMWMNALLIWLVGAGVIGEEVSSGTILLVLSRPVSRSEYVFSKWIALACATAGVLAVQAVAIAAIAGWRGHPVEAVALVRQVLEAVFRAFGASAVVVMFSALVPGAKEMSVMMFTWLGGTLLGLLGQWKQWTAVTLGGGEVTSFMLPALDLGPLFGGGGFTWSGPVGYLSTVTLALAVAVWWLNRKELSYAGS